VRDTSITDITIGFWPDEWTKQSAWQPLGKLILWRWKWGEPVPSEPVVAIDDPLIIESKIAIRKDGLLTIVFSKNEISGSTTSLWFTSSWDGKHWQNPVRLTDGKFLDRDIAAIHYNDALWVSFARNKPNYKPNIYLLKYDKLPAKDSSCSVRQQ